MKNINYVLVVVMLLLISCGGEDSVSPQEDIFSQDTLLNIEYRPVSERTYVEFYTQNTVGEKYRLYKEELDPKVYPTNFTIQRIPNETEKVNLVFSGDSIVECNVSTNVVIPYGKYKVVTFQVVPALYVTDVPANQTVQQWLLNKLITSSISGSTLDNVPFLDAVSVLNYTKEGVTYTVRYKEERTDFGTLRELEFSSRESTEFYGPHKIIAYLEKID